ncbi:MAG: hydrolase family protein [Patescibacteria group bacterium]|nr:hydrolase family protein [Patescibacteria group bacterium]
MAVTRHKVRSILMVIALMTAFLSFPSTANATTDYDNITVSGGSLTISYHAQPWTGVTCTSHTVDLTNSWKAILLDSSKWDIGGSISSGDAADAIDDLETALGNGSGWGVAQIYSTDAGLNSFGSSLSAYGGAQDAWLEIW